MSWNDDAGGGYDRGDGVYFTPSALKANAKSKARAKEIVITAEHQGITREIAPTRAVRKAILQEIARKAKEEENQNEKETVTKGKAKDRGVRAKAFGK